MDVRVEDAPIPDITQERDIILKVTGTTICGSDLHLYHSEMLGLQKGDILGHEFMLVYPYPLFSSLTRLIGNQGYCR